MAAKWKDCVPQQVSLKANRLGVCKAILMHFLKHLFLQMQVNKGRYSMLFLREKLEMCRKIAIWIVAVSELVWRACRIHCQNKLPSLLVMFLIKNGHTEILRTCTARLTTPVNLIHQTMKSANMIWQTEICWFATFTKWRKQMNKPMISLQLYYAKCLMIFLLGKVIRSVNTLYIFNTTCLKKIQYLHLMVSKVQKL